MFDVPYGACSFIRIGTERKQAVQLNVSDDKIVPGRNPCIWVRVNPLVCAEVTSGCRIIEINGTEGLIKITKKKHQGKNN